ncbi:MAG: hypothetical protein ACRDSJ_14805 [Rubrobacteraceae bacterium]
MVVTINIPTGAAGPKEPLPARNFCGGEAGCPTKRRDLGLADERGLVEFKARFTRSDLEWISPRER